MYAKNNAPATVDAVVRAQSEGDAIHEAITRAYRSIANGGAYEIVPGTWAVRVFLLATPDSDPACRLINTKEHEELAHRHGERTASWMLGDAPASYFAQRTLDDRAEREA